MAGGAQDRPGGGEKVKSAVKTLLDEDPPCHGDNGQVPAARDLDCVTDRASEDGGAGALVDVDAIQPRG